MAEATVSTKTYLTVTAALMVLLGLTWGVHYLPFSGTVQVVLALGFAGAKMLLIVLYFMHVRYSSRTTAVVVALILMWVLILFTLTFGDYLTRDWLGPAYPPGQTTETARPDGAGPPHGAAQGGTTPGSTPSTSGSSA